MGNEQKLRILRLDEVKGKNRLSIIEQRGAIANPTEFAVDIGCYWESYIKDNIEVDKKGNKRYYRTKELICGDYYLERQGTDKNILEAIGAKLTYYESDDKKIKQTQEYFNKEINEISGGKNVIAIGRKALQSYINDDDIAIIHKETEEYGRHVGIRLAMPINENNVIPTNGEPPKESEDGVLEVEYGFLPNRKVKGKEYDKLKKAEAKGKLIETPYEYTIDDRKIGIDDGKEVIPNKRKVYMYDGKLYIKFDYSIKVFDDRWGPRRYVVQEGFCEIEPVKWLVDLEAKTMITQDIVWGGAEYDNIRVIIKLLEKEMFQIRGKDEIAKFESDKKGFFYNLFHQKDKVKALPEGTYQMEQGKTNDEQEVGTEITKSEQNAINEFQEGIRKAAKAETKVTEEAAQVNPVEERVNNILDAQINRADGEIYQQPQYYAKPQKSRTDIRYYVKGEDGELYLTGDANNSDYYIGSDGVVRPTKETIENHREDSERPNNQYVAKITADKLLKKPARPKVDLSKPPYEPKEKKTNPEEQDDGTER